jgi:hypothetical protein
MKLNDFIDNLLKLQAEGHGDKEVFYRHGPSGDCGELSSAHITDEIDFSCGPFDLAEGEEYVSIGAFHQCRIRPYRTMGLYLDA